MADVDPGLRERFAAGVRSGAIQRTDEEVLRALHFTIDEWLNLDWRARAYWRWLIWSDRYEEAVEQ